MRNSFAHLCWRLNCLLYWLHIIVGWVLTDMTIYQYQGLGGCCCDTLNTFAIFSFSFYLSFSLSFFFLSTKSQHDCILQWKITTIQKCAWLHYGCIFEDSKLYLQHKGRLNKWLSIFVPLSPHFMAAFSTWCKSKYTCEISHFCSLFYITVMHLHWNIILWLISIWNCF